MRRRLFLALLATAAATPSDLNVWFADPAGDVGAPPEEDTCYASTAFGQEYDAQAGCGAAAAVNGVALPADSYSDVTFIGNARNAIFITTSTWESADIGSASQYNVSIALQVSSESDDEVVLCSEAAMLREGYDEGLKNVAVTGLADPTSPRSDATIWPSDQGNTLYVIPYTLRPARSPPYPELTLTLIPLLVRENFHENGTTDEAGVTTYSCEQSGFELQEDDTCRSFELTRLDPMVLKVRVRTEPLLETLRSEYVSNCEYAYAQDHVTELGDASEEEEETTSSAPSPPGAARWRIAAAVASAVVLHSARARRRTHG